MGTPPDLVVSALVAANGGVATYKDDRGWEMLVPVPPGTLSGTVIQTRGYRFRVLVAVPRRSNEAVRERLPARRVRRSEVLVCEQALQSATTQVDALSNATGLSTSEVAGALNVLAAYPWFWEALLEENQLHTARAAPPQRS